MNQKHKNMYTKMLCRVIVDYQSAYPDPLKITAGEPLLLGQNDAEWPGFVWCANRSGQGGWMPERYIERQTGSSGLARYDYEATELTVQAGETLTVETEESGWLWCIGPGGRRGWIPQRHVEILPEPAQALSYTFKELTPTPFDLEATVRSHGWAALQPFNWRPDPIELGRVHRLESGQVVLLRLWAEGGDPTQKIQIEVQAVEPLLPEDEAELRRIVRRMLRLDEDLGEFHRLREQLDGWQLKVGPGGGRLLRCPRLFEDIIYTLCTTNIAWSGTKRMVERLTVRLGAPYPGQVERHAFPTAEAIAQTGPDFLKQETGLGYRSDYIWRLATAVAEGRLDLTSFEASEQPTEALYKALRQIKGVGAYAAATILMLLGRYEFLAIDSELRAFVTGKYFDGQPPTEAQIRAIYEPWGRWRYLAYWFDTG